MSLLEFKNVITGTAKAIIDSEKFPTEVLAVRARRAAEANPYDNTLVGMSNFLAKRASKSPLISRSELKAAYQTLYTTNNKFAEIFAEELGKTEEEAPKRTLFTRDPQEGTDLVQTAYQKLADPVLTNVLTSVFNKQAEYKPYSAAMGTAAARTCLHELNRFVAPRKVDVVAGREDAIICQATYQTPKGESVVLIPVEIAQNKALLPSVFLSQAGFVDLSKKALEEHLQATAGQAYRVDAQKLLEVVNFAKHGAPKTVSPLEVIIAKAKAAKGTPASHTAEGILYQTVEASEPNVKIEKTAESLEFGKKLSSPKGAAEFIFGSPIVEASRKLISSTLKTLGFKQANIVVADADQGNIYFAVSVDNKAFKVPTKVANGQPQLPKSILASGKLYPLTNTGLSSLFASEEVDTSLKAVASPAYGLKPAELIEQIKIAMLSDNLAMAEDSLGVLQASGDVRAYQQGCQLYLDGVSGKLVKEASEKSCCSLQRKIAHSKYMICGHTNLPVHKVYQDEHGDCQPLYRKHIAPAGTGSFLHSRVYLG